MMTSNQQLSVLVAILGARMRYAVPIAFKQCNILAKLYTDFYFSKEGKSKFISQTIRKLPLRVSRRAELRYDARLPYSKVSHFDSFGYLYTFCLHLSRSYAQRGAINSFFQKKFANKVAEANWYGANTVYGINFASKEIFERARKVNVCCILEQCSAPLNVMNSLYQEEKEKWQEWQDLELFSLKSQQERENEEWALADGVLCGSKFVKDSLEACGVPANKSFVIPYAVDTEKFYPPIHKFSSERKRCLNILYVGEVDIRKGIQYLYGATKFLDLSRFVFKVAGHVSLKDYAVRKLNGTFDLLGLVPHNKISDLFRWADVFVLPTVSEGSALVTYEALASGVPVITTENAGSVVRDGINGFIVPLRDSEAIADRLNCLANNQEMLQKMSIEARSYSVNQLSWSAYTERLVKTCRTIQKKAAGK